MGAAGSTSFERFFLGQSFSVKEPPRGMQQTSHNDACGTVHHARHYAGLCAPASIAHRIKCLISDEEVKRGGAESTTPQTNEQCIAGSLKVCNIQLVLKEGARLKQMMPFPEVSYGKQTHCTTNTVIADYRGSASVQMPA